jgi:hypothetical protein
VIWRFIIWQLLCEWQVTIEDQSLLSVLYMYDSFFNRYVTPWMKNSSVMLLTGWLPPFYRPFCDKNSNFRLLDLSASERWSPVRICGCYSSFAEWSSAVTHHSQNDLRLLLIICRVNVKWKTATACLFRIKTWKWNQKGIKLCSGNPKFFISITWMSL